MDTKVVIVGSSDGLGLSIAKHLQTYPDFHPLIWGRDHDKTSQIASDLNLPFVTADVRDFQQVEQAFNQSAQTLGGIDVVINCAGIWCQGTIDNQSPELIQNIFQTNTLGAVWVAKSAFGHLIASNNNPLFVNIISQDGLTVKPQRAVYSSSKWALTGFTRSLFIDWKETSIRICGVYPGPFKSNLFKKSGFDRDFTNSREVDEVASKIVDLVTNPKNFIQELVI